MRKMITVMIVTLGSAGIMSCSVKNFDNTPVSSLDLNRYLGRWYEIARYDHRFERGMQYTTADYTVTKGGKIRVTNRGIRKNKQAASNGVARLTDQPGILRVSFFRPFWSDYRVLMIGPDYEYALVGSRSRNYLWILSRSPTLPDSTTDEILGEMCIRGYSVSKLIWVNQ